MDNSPSEKMRDLVMKTKIVYVLVSNTNDCYYEQLLISLYSLRLYNPNTIVEVVTDSVTKSSLVGPRTDLIKYINDILTIDLPDFLSPFEKSRFLKTRLREYISGDFLYIDTDTVVCGDLSGIDSVKGDIAAVYDKNRKLPLSKLSGWPYDIAKKIGFASDISGEPYFNGGVILAKDTTKAHLFYDEWHKYWTICKERGVSTDQTALCLANKCLGHIISSMESKWNCQINADGLLCSNDALIIHYFSNKYPQYLLSRQSVQETVKYYESIPPFVIDFIKTPTLVLTSPKDLSKVQIKKICGPVYLLFRRIKSIFTILFKK